MNKYFAFLRALNVGGRNIKMDILKKYFEDMKFKNVETFIASGNVIFESGVKNIASLENKIEKHLLNKLGYEVAAFIRTYHELEAITTFNPFEEKEINSAQALNVAFLKQSLNSGQITKLDSFKTDIDNFRAHGREVYWLCKKKQSESKFSNAVFERVLKIEATFRGINTINKLAVKYGEQIL